MELVPAMVSARPANMETPPSASLTATLMLESIPRKGDPWTKSEGKGCMNSPIGWGRTLPWYEETV